MVSDAFIFPNGTKMTTVQPELMPAGRLLSPQNHAGGWRKLGRVWRVVQPWRPVRLDFSDARRFRKALAQLITGIEMASQKDSYESTVTRIMRRLEDLPCTLLPVRHALSPANSGSRRMLGRQIQCLPYLYLCLI